MKKDELGVIVPMETIEHLIYIIRGNRVMVDRDLAVLYGVKTKQLIQTVKRNIERFPDDFMFQLTKEELENWRSQIVTSNSSAKMGLRRCPYVFTEQGVAMLSGVLRSPQAIKVNIEIMRAFIRLRQVLNINNDLSKRFNELRDFVLQNSLNTNKEFRKIWNTIEELSAKPKENNERRIGFRLDGENK